MGLMQTNSRQIAVPLASSKASPKLWREQFLPPAEAGQQAKAVRAGELPQPLEGESRQDESSWQQAGMHWTHHPGNLLPRLMSLWCNLVQNKDKRYLLAWSPTEKPQEGDKSL